MVLWSWQVCCDWPGSAEPIPGSRVSGMATLMSLKLPDCLSDFPASYSYGFPCSKHFIQMCIFCAWLCYLAQCFHSSSMLWHETILPFNGKWYSIIWIYHTLFNHLSVDGHLGCLHSLTSLNNATMNISVHISSRISVNFSTFIILSIWWDVLPLSFSSLVMVSFNSLTFKKVYLKYLSSKSNVCTLSQTAYFLLPFLLCWTMHASYIFLEECTCFTLSCHNSVNQILPSHWFCNISEGILWSLYFLLCVATEVFVSLACGLLMIS